MDSSFSTATTSSSSSSSSSTLVWKQKPGASGRRLKYWLKNNLVRHQDVIFEEPVETEHSCDKDNEQVTNQRHCETHNNHTTFDVNDEQNDVKNGFFLSQEDENDDYCDRDSRSTEVMYESDYFVCRNIDEAMSSLHDFVLAGSNNTLPERYNTTKGEAFSVQQQETVEECNEYYDWILDGDPEWAEEVEKTEELQQSLGQLELEDPAAAALLLSQLGGGGDQNLKFANFDDDFLSSPEKLEESNSGSNSRKSCGVCPDPDDDNDDDEFGDFVTAQPTDESDTDSKHESNIHGSLDDDVRAEEELTADYYYSATISDPTRRPTPKEGHSSQASDKHMELKPLKVERTPYDFLPLEDVSTPEGRFIRKRQLATTQFAGSSSSSSNFDSRDFSEIQTAGKVFDSNEGGDDLPEEYYDENFDGTLQVLNSVPWDSVLFWQSKETWLSCDSEEEANNKLLQVEDFLTQQLSELDASSESISSKLLKQIQKRENMMDEANQLLHDMDHNLAMADMYVHRGRDVVARARGKDEDFTGLVGMGVLLEDSMKRDQLRQLQVDLDRVAAILQTEASLESRINSFVLGGGGGGGPATAKTTIQETSALACREYRYDVIRIATQLRNDVTTNTSLSRLLALDDFRKRACTLLDLFHDRLHINLAGFVGRCCTNSDFSNSQYESLVSAMLDLQTNERGSSIARNIHGNSVEEKKDSEKGGDENGGHQSFGDKWADCLLETLCYQADKCFARALLDPVLFDDKIATIESDYEKELIHLQYELNSGPSCDMAKLQTLVHNLVTIRFDFELKRNYLPCVYHKVCQSLADVLHTHYILTQWHEMPFDERNTDIRFLHRKEQNERSHISTSQENKNERDNAELGKILRKLDESRLYLWKHCESVLVRCLDEYLNCATKNKMFQNPEEGILCYEDTSVEYSEGLQYIMVLTKMFVSLGQQFVGSDKFGPQQITMLEPDGEYSDLRERLQDVCQKYLRALHVEAMNDMGKTLFNESWHLFPIGVGNDNIESSDASNLDDSNNPTSTFAQSQSLKNFMTEAISQSVPTMNTKLQCWKKQLSESSISTTDHLSNYVNAGNPFVVTAGSEDARKPMASVFENTAVALCDKLGFREGVEISPDDTSSYDTDLYSMIAACCGSNGPLLATESATKGLAYWCCKLLLAMHRLPLIRGDVHIVFSNIFDLYFTTVLRICAGNAKHENVILGTMPATRQSQDSTEQNLPSTPNTSAGANRRNPSTSGFFGRQKNRPRSIPRPAPVLSPHTAADICAPLPNEMAKIAALRKFMSRGQKSLDGIVNLELIEQWLPNPVIPSTGIDDNAMISITTTLEKRAGAAWSCMFAGVLLDFVGTFVTETFKSSEDYDRTKITVDATGNETKKSLPVEYLVSLLLYKQSAADIVPCIIRMTNRMSCVRAILSREIVQQIIEVNWEESTLNEYSNTYVDQLSVRCARLWKFLCTSEQKLPRGVLHQVWSDIIGGAYLALLEGFSKISQCSTEGRALMSMDLASFSSGIAPSSIVADRPRINTPPTINPQRGMQYVDTYVKVYYYPEEDVMNWVAQNHRAVQLEHSLALVFATSENDDQDLQERIDTVKHLYEAATLAHAS